MNKVLIVIMFILLGTSLIVVSNMSKGVDNSFAIEYQNNKNLALPDLDGKTEISVGIYRLYNDNGIIIDYNVYNGNYIVNGTSIDVGFVYLTNLPIIEGGQTVSRSTYYVSGYVNEIKYSINFNMGMTEISKNDLWIEYDYLSLNNTITGTVVDGQKLRIYISNGKVFDNFTFRLQFEKGSQATSYVVPKLIPVYKDNLTQQEKNNIGIGAFGGITKIIKTINDIIKPVGDFINGLLSLF